ncbi:MAG: FCD domain-containing protein [Eubacteriales bacterium]|nr:FCD domain-containing protein [Eubacteriales bacterium]
MKNLKKEDKLYIQTFREIRGYIIRNNLREGDSLPTEQQMCEMLGVSRNVLREAIKSMELMGMIQSCPGRGTVVKAFNLDFIFQNVLFFTVGEEKRSIREMLGIRKMIELSYMREAYLALTDSDIRKIRDSLEAIKTKWEQHIFFHADDKAFHMTLFAHLKNSVLTSLLEAIWAVDENFQPEEKAKHLGDTIAKHENIVLALENHDYEAFAKAMESHFASGKYSNLNSFEEY